LFVVNLEFEDSCATLSISSRCFSIYEGTVSYWLYDLFFSFTLRVFILT